MTHQQSPSIGCYYATIITGGLLLAAAVVFIGYVTIVGLP